MAYCGIAGAATVSFSWCVQKSQWVIYCYIGHSIGLGVYVDCWVASQQHTTDWYYKK